MATSYIYRDKILEEFISLVFNTCFLKKDNRNNILNCCENLSVSLFCVILCIESSCLLTLNGKVINTYLAYNRTYKCILCCTCNCTNKFRIQLL